MVAWVSFWLDGAEYKALVFRRVGEWRDAVELQHHRLIVEGSQSEADMRFYILALHNLRDAAKAIRGHYKKEAAAVGRAIRVFENHVLICTFSGISSNTLKNMTGVRADYMRRALFR